MDPFAITPNTTIDPIEAVCVGIQQALWWPGVFAAIALAGMLLWKLVAALWDWCASIDKT